MTEFTTPEGHRVQRTPHPDGPRYGELIKVTRGDDSVANRRAEYLRQTDPLADYVDGDDVRHAWDHAGDHSFDATPNWFHPDPRRPVCRDRTCPGNRLVQRGSLAAIRVVGGGTRDGVEELHYKITDDVATGVDVHARLVEFVRDLDWELRFEASQADHGSQETS